MAIQMTVTAGSDFFSVYIFGFLLKNINYKSAMRAESIYE